VHKKYEKFQIVMKEIKKEQKIINTLFNTKYFERK
jgi:hypothetical protein